MTKFAVIQELVHRDGLRSALAGRDDVLLEPVLALLVKYVHDPRFGELVCDVGSLVIGMSFSRVFAALLNPRTFRDVLASTRAVPVDRLMVHPSAKEDFPRDQVPTGTDEDKRRAGYVVHLRCIDGIMRSLVHMKSIYE